MTVIAIQNPALNITKVVNTSTCTDAGQTIQYIYNVTNSGNVDLIGPINVIDNTATVPPSQFQ